MFHAKGESQQAFSDPKFEVGKEVIWNILWYEGPSTYNITIFKEGYEGRSKINKNDDRVGFYSEKSDEFVISPNR